SIARTDGVKCAIAVTDEVSVLGVNSRAELAAAESRFQDRMRALGPGGVLALTVFRRDELRTVEVTLSEPPVEVAWLEPVPDPTPAQQAAFQAWTGAALP
ncbi:MAG: hypothetical protein WCS72_12535, partial [Deltaproteobacteria bacterium]